MIKTNRKISVGIISHVVGKTPEVLSRSFVFDEAYKLVHKGIDVHVIRSNFEKDSFLYGINYHGLDRKIDPRTLGFIVKNLNVYMPLSLLRRPTLIYWENLYAINVSKVVKKYNIDLIHAHFAYPEGLVGLLTKRETRKPLIVTLHGYDILVEPSVGYGIRLMKKYDAIVRAVLKDADRVIVASRAAYGEAARLCHSDKIVLIPNGVDTIRFNPELDGSVIREKCGIEDAFVVFTVRHHEPQYGIEYLIRAIPHVTHRRNDVVFVIGGNGTLRKYHEHLAYELGVKNHTIFTGRIPRNDLPLFYAASDVVVIPSLQEAWGLVCTEAMACGKPVIGSDVGGLRDQIIDSFNGFLVPPKDSRAIAEKILYLIENPDKAKKLGFNGRKLVVERFSIEKRIDKLVELYEEVLKGSC